ncbi:sulfatase family protein [Pelagicoccus mobilis]|uniref:Sulfatase-like hydrolase/transferase n=1 Tax=Pelagicoccus mobilis TaxID=415221 RepID=A0A934S100_9BACT|nr:sulfatase-like hydrolase/transferase [Pelagicoccus mobilis]MBK1879014.1 sulfatase-like hydrolase/transferase [Pelagicoccus mobilis]
MLQRLGLLALLFCLCSLSYGGKQRPNIILVMADDLGWGQVGYYDHPDLETPNLDAMAANGLRFDRFYAGAPVCSPTRASVLTGRSNDRTGAISHGYALRRQEKTIATALANIGYETAHFGKWHLNALRGPGIPLLENDPYHPGHFGFQHWLTTSNFFDLNPLMSREGAFEDFQGDSSEVVVDQALQFIKKRKDKNRPFFSVIWYGTPHSPFTAFDEDAARFSNHEEDKKNQYGEIIAMDRSIGTLRKGLRDLGIADNTIVWFCSDNGGLKSMGPETVNGLRGFKGSLYEGGIRVPAIIEWPAVIKKGSATKTPTATMDIFPTIATLVAANKEDMLQPSDGSDLSSLINGKSFERKHPIPFRHIGRGALIDGNYKLISLDYEGGEFALYNLEKDPSETTNLVAEKPKVAKRLIRVFRKWNQSVDRSAEGKDYPEGKLTTPDPEPMHWAQSKIFAPYFEEWSKRPEYGYWIERWTKR